VKLLLEIIQRRMEVMKERELNNEQFKAIWHFYQVYQLCTNFLGIDSNMKPRNELIRKLLSRPEDLRLIGKIKSFMGQDNQIIEMVLNSIKENEEIDEVFEDFYPTSVFAVNIDDRGI